MDTHIILRGGKEPNYDASHIDKVSDELKAAKLPENIMIDLSHANSRKEHNAQIDVGNVVAEQIANGDIRIFGVMIESHLVEGKQDVKTGCELTYGQSITDACIGWENTVKLIELLAKASKKRKTKLSLVLF